ncbi:histidinol-phosphate transaminase [Butyrivibrio sp. AE2032]|uniref:histidinol-phosphate transaminase n=1 Tax=Butyrivibrio sp. AE2032 TaxID=1458463 RepID=UPI00055571D6|nr:histidinol-phosphate transaminase [Butyrivibrio sp. AE2032]
MSWEDNVRKVVPYVPGEQPKIKNIIKLNTNECPYPPAPGVQEKLRNMDYDDFRLYPDPEASTLTTALSKYYGVPKDQIFVGVGSDDVISMAFMTFFNSRKEILFPDVTYSFYDVWADLYRIPYKRVPLDGDFKIRKEDYYGKNGGVIFPNPNAPTGILEDLDMIEDVVKHNPDVVVIVDEAYIDFGGKSALPLIEKYDNLLVVQTFSKSRSMAGLRIGYAFGSKKLIGYLQDAKFSFNSYTMNRPSLEVGAAAVEDDAYFKEVCSKIIATRERVKPEFAKLGFEFTDSQANFIFARHKTVPGKEIFDKLRERGIIVRRWDAHRIADHLRITIGTDEEMDKLLEALKEILA